MSLMRLILIGWREDEFAAVDDEGLPGCVATGVAREIKGESRYLFRLCNPLHRVRISSRFLDHLDQRSSHLGAHDSGSDTVDPNFVARPLLRADLRQCDQSSLAYRIGPKPEAWTDSLIRRDVNHGPAAARLHRW